MDRKRIREFIRFAAAGFGCFLIELGLFAFLNRGLRWGTVLSTTVAFLVSVAANYLLCMYWVFKGTKDSGNKAKAAFLITSVIGWALNVALMLLFARLWGEETVLFTAFGKAVQVVLLNKVLATMLVMAWNYFTKRRILMKK